MDRVPITIDTREQAPWAFPASHAAVQRGTLPVGDYAVTGDRHLVIERKSIPDMAQTVGRHWDRFGRELDTMARLAHIARIVIVEGSLYDFLCGPERKDGMAPAYLTRRIAELALRNITVLTPGNREMATGMAYRILLQRWLQIRDKKEK